MDIGVSIRDEDKEEIIRVNKRTIANLDIDGQTGSIMIRHNNSDARRGVHSILVKLDGEKQFILMTVRDDMSNATIKDAISGYIGTEYVTNWFI